MRAAECSTRAERRMVCMRRRSRAGDVARRPRFGDNGAMSKNSNKKTGKDKGKGAAGGTIALTKRARHEYALEEKFEAGLSLQGWELKAIRAGRANIGDAYAVVLHNEIFLIGSQITPLISASTH